MFEGVRAFRAELATYGVLGGHIETLSMSRKVPVGQRGRCTGVAFGDGFKLQLASVARVCGRNAHLAPALRT